MIGLALVQSKTPGAGLGVLASKLFVAVEIISHYYGTLSADKLAVGTSNRPSMYGKAMISVPVRNASKCSLQLIFETTCGLNVWIYHVPFCDMNLLNEFNYTNDEEGRPTATELIESPHLYSATMKNCRCVKRETYYGWLSKTFYSAHQSYGEHP